MDKASSISAPVDFQSRLTLVGPSFSDPRLYRQVIASLQYTTITRPDIAYDVNRVCQYMHSPTTLYWQALKRILHYLNGTLDHCLHFSPTFKTSLLDYSDAGRLSEKYDNYSQYDFSIYHGPNLIRWASRKQRVVACSSTKAEYQSLAYTPVELIWIKQLLTELDACSYSRSSIVAAW